MPPRHGKSEFVSKYFPAWYLGAFPDRRVILASYEADFAASWGRKVRDILAEYGPAWFGVGVRQDSRAVDQWEIEGRTGGMVTAGVGGALTGRGANILLIDDPIKNAEQANSTVYREKTWDWYASTAYTRLEPDGVICLIQTRWHEDDLAGRLLAQAKAGGEHWEHVNLPALAESGDPLGRPEDAPLWPERFDAEALERIRATLGMIHFSALYQQRPGPAEGSLFKRGWFRYWRPEGDEHFRLGAAEPVRVSRIDCRRFGVVDLAFSTRREADFTVVSAWAVTPKSDLILLDLYRERMEGPDILPALTRIQARYNLSYWGIEANGAQLAIVQEARRRGLTIRALKADTDKLTRSMTAQVRCEAEQVYFPERAPWLGDFEAELLGFPKAAHDDCVDVLSYAALETARGANTFELISL